ncbi:MAG: phosphatase PAP2 family protein [Ruminococcaceae bacterium]|nr:phosphatase PAP2 family protein [Oscillospiraceae bacterium]
MKLLYFFESIRNPVLDAFFSFITHLGSEAAFLAIALFIYWCVNKKAGYYLLFTGFLGITLNQFLKLAFKVERPWVRDKNFTIVESARADAGGYSFPSGHTQNAVGIFGSIGLFFRKKIWVVCLSLSAILLTAVSRMYLGVHTPLDVLVSIALGILLVFLVYPIISKAFENEKAMYILTFITIAIVSAYLCYVEFYSFPADIDPENYKSGLKNAYSLLGAVLAFPLIYFFDKKYVKFDTKATVSVQIIKLSLGLAIALALKSVLKAPLNAIFSGHNIAHAIRYFVLVIFAGVVWPMTFRFFKKIQSKNNL